MDRAPPHRLPASKEVTHRWDLNLSASFSSQDLAWFTRRRIVSRPPIRCLIPYRCCPGCFLFASAASYPTLPVHRSDPAMISMLKVQIVMLPTAVRYLTPPWRERFEDSEDLNALPCMARVVFNLFKVSRVRGFNSEYVPRPVPST